MTHYLIEFTNRTAAKNALQKEIYDIMSQEHRRVITEDEKDSFMTALTEQVQAAHENNPRCRKLTVSLYEYDGDPSFEVSPPCENTFCRLALLRFEL